MTPELPALAGYPVTSADEVVDPSGRLRGAAEPLRAVLRRTDLRALAGTASAAFQARGGEVGVRADGRPLVQAVPLDPLPRPLPRGDWDTVAGGVSQRHRALEAFLWDVYRASGRRRGDPDRAPEIVRAGVLPEWAVAGSPGRNPAAVGMAWPGQRRISLLACDVARAGDGRWLVRADDARVPTGLGAAVAARRGIASGAPALLPAPDVADPAGALAVLRAALAAAAPPRCAGVPVPAVLGCDTAASAADEAVLAEALDAPLVTAADLWPRLDGGVAVTVGGRRLPIDVLHLRVDDAELGATRTPTGQTVGTLLREAVRIGLLSLANVPGNALADDPTTYVGVPGMIRFYLGEEPRLDQVPTWVLADEDQWVAVRERLHELVLVPVAAYGGGRAVVGPECSAAELAELQAEVAAAPHRFIARALVETTTAPTLVGDRLLPRPVDLRVFSVSSGEGVRVLDAPLTRVDTTGRAPGFDLGRGAAVKDTWLLGS